MLQLFYIPGAFLAFFLGFLIITKKRKEAHDYLLSVWLFLICFHVLTFYIDAGEYSVSPIVLYINAAFPLVQGPFLLLYTMLLLKKAEFNPRLLTHFIPFLFTAIFASVQSQVNNWVIFLIVISGTIYLSLTARILSRLKGANSKTNNSWLRLITMGLALVWVIFMITGIVNHLLDNEPIEHEYIFLSVNIFVFAIGYFGLKDGLVLQAPKFKGKYTSSPLKEANLVEIKVRLKNTMTKDKLYLDPDLNIEKLAKHLEAPTHHLSQVFSALLDSNYYDYVNQFRVDELKTKIKENELETTSLLGLAYDSGFKSKSTFNRAFKKLTHQTPSEYISSEKLVSNN